MWSNRQKYMVHLYAGSAALSDAEYRRILVTICGPRKDGSRSAADRDLTQWCFDQVMARIEGRLDWAIQEGLVPPPAPKRIPDLWHWRKRLVKPGAMTTRQDRRIKDLWSELCPNLPDTARSPQYLLAIASKACGLGIESLDHLTDWQAARLIDALQDRLAYATRPTRTA